MSKEVLFFGKLVIWLSLAFKDITIVFRFCIFTVLIFNNEYTFYCYWRERHAQPSISFTPKRIPNNWK